MNIRQEESTPIGDYFHDCGIAGLYSKIESAVDEFDVDTDELTARCDMLIDALKGLKTRIKQAETAWQKYQSRQKAMDSLNKGFE